MIPLWARIPEPGRAHVSKYGVLWYATVKPLDGGVSSTTWAGSQPAAMDDALRQVGQ